MPRSRRPSTDRDEAVRVHAMRILADRPTITGTTAIRRSLVRAGLKDDSARVRRASAEALGSHPSTDDVPMLLALDRSVDPADTHLKHVARIALRDQLLTTSEAWDYVAWPEVGSPEDE